MVGKSPSLFYQDQSFPSQRHVSYSCGCCGYELNLSSSDRITSTIGSKYRKSIKKGIISFSNIDESRFTQVDEFRCIPHFSKNSWGLFRHRANLLCRNCGSHVGKASEDKASAYVSVTDGSDSSPGDAAAQGPGKYDIKIAAVLPASVAQGSGSPFLF